MVTQNSLAAKNIRPPKAPQKKDWGFMLRHPLVGWKYFKGIGRNLYELKPEIYDEYISTRMEADNFNMVFKKLLEAVGPRLPDSSVKVLDLCCGTGIFPRKWLRHLGQYDISYTGVDINRAFLAYARKKMHEDHRFNFVCADAASVKLGVKFDAVVATSSYHHIPDERKLEFLRNIREHLKEGGALVIYEKAVESFHTRGEQEQSGIDFYEERIAHMKSSERLTDSQLFALYNEMYLTATRREEYKVPYERICQDLLAAGFSIKEIVKIWPQWAMEDSATYGDYVFVAKKAAPQPGSTVIPGT